MVSQLNQTGADASRNRFPHSVEPSLLLHRHIGRTGTLDLLAQTACGHASMVSAVGAQLSVEHPVLHAPQSVAGAHRHRSTRRTGHSLHHFRNARTPFGSVDHGPLLLLDPLCDLSEPLHSSSQLNAAVGHGIIPNGRIPVYFSSSFVRILHGLRDNLLIIINYGQQQSLRSGSGQNPRQSAGCERHCERREKYRKREKRRNRRQIQRFRQSFAAEQLETGYPARQAERLEPEQTLRQGQPRKEHKQDRRPIRQPIGFAELQQTDRQINVADIISGNAV